ncbi:MAG: PEP-utilizing enzyme, partial [bacterium]
MKKWTNLWTTRPYSPFLMSQVVKATVIKFSNEIFPKSAITKGGTYWKNKSENYFYIDYEIDKTVDLLSKKALKSPQFLYNLFEAAFKKAIALNKFTEKYGRSSLKNAPSKDLVSHLKKLEKKFYNMYAYATNAALMGYIDDNPIYKGANDILNKKLANAAFDKKLMGLADYLVILTNPPRRLKTLEQGLEILKIAKIAKSKKYVSQKEILKNFYRELKKIKNKYEFLSFDFCDTINWDLKHYANLVKERAGLKNIEKQIYDLENYDRITNEKFKKSCVELALSESEIKVFNLIKFLGYYKWAREHEFQHALYNIKFVQDELGKRCGLSSLETKYLLPHELEKALLEPEKYKKLAEERFKHCLIVADKNKGVQIWQGEEARIRYEKMEFIKESDEDFTKILSLKGTPARAGKAKGAVKIINTVKHNYKMEKGDILISQATTPDLLSAMKKAAAIITNEGGITCHAAIVSRELGIPCIVGTK